MSYRLKMMPVDGGLVMSEKACENYVCSSCGRKMISVNFVNGICIQVFVSHAAECNNFLGNVFRKTVAVTCETCKYYDGACGCTYEGGENPVMADVRTGA